MTKKLYETISTDDFHALNDEDKRIVLDDFNKDWRNPDTLKLLPGHPGIPGRMGPTKKGKKRQQQEEYLRAINSAMSPDDLLEALTLAKEYAIKQRSARLLMEIINFTTDRMLGKPTQSMEVSQVTPEQWRAQMDERLQDEPVQLPGEEVIEAEFRQLGTHGYLSGPRDTGEGPGPEDSVGDTDGDIQVVDEV